MADDKTRGVYEKVPGSGEWWIRWQDERKIIRRKKIGKKSHAKAAVEQMRARVRLGDLVPELVADKRQRVTLAAALDHVLRTSKNTPRVKQYEAYYAERWAKEFPNKLLDEIQPSDIERWMAKREREGVTPATIVHQLSFLSKTFRVAIRSHWTKENPVAAVDRPSVNKRKTRFYDELEIRRMRDYLLEHNGPLAWWILQLAILTGLRRTELLTLTRENVDLENAFAILPETKSGGVQVIHLSEDAVDVFRDVLAAHDLPWVFPGARGQGPLHGTNFHRRVFRPMLLALGIEDANFHTARHSHASHLALRGATIQEIRDSLRHKSTVTSERYAHLTDKSRQKTVQKLAGLTGTTTSTEESLKRANR
jgi:integrase